MRLIDGDELLTAFPVDDEPTLTKACVRMTIQHMPTIEPMRGKWIHRKSWDRYVCSECSTEQKATSNYCPNCGAEMEGEEE